MNPPSFLSKDTDISSLSGYKTQAVAAYYYEINNLSDTENLSTIYNWSQKSKCPFLILGGGMNCLFAFDTFPGVIIKNNLDDWSYDTTSKILTTESNTPIWNIAQELEEKYHQPIWHRFIGLPGSIGGAIYGNAGCFGLETEHNFLDAHILSLGTGEVRIWNKGEMDFSYRSSFLKSRNGYFIISSRFDLAEIREKYHSDVDNIYFREHKQPKGNTCGSFFKNPSKEKTAGMLIEAIGAKGMRIGGAQFSPLHANFLMSDGRGCRWQDLVELVELVELRVKKEYDITLEREVQVIYPEKYVSI